jgi:hypothetical protein
MGVNFKERKGGVFRGGVRVIRPGKDLVKVFSFIMARYVVVFKKDLFSGRGRRVKG